MNKPIKLDYKKAYNELKKVNSNLGSTIRKLESEVKFKDALLDECQKKNECRITELEKSRDSLVKSIHSGLKEINDLQNELKRSNKIIDKLIQ